ncbi:hypothetical protein DU504_03500 [Haloplanus salinus]|uniref:Uncharacterized protein n=1 Tax=Haloplanus salinus TaxID=1126245 RepID=A0A368N8W8_9EURY|nr:hypothetical protein [Haloplanus salinus]RCU46453.1 hypothetical protein DU504_03500 [Haloplanus salinus]
MTLHRRAVARSAVATFLAGLVLWPPRAVYWTRLATVVGDAVTLVVVCLLALAVGAVLARVAGVDFPSFAVGALLAYAVGMAAVEAWLSPDSPAHLVWYAGLLVCLVGGAALRESLPY